MNITSKEQLMDALNAPNVVHMDTSELSTLIGIANTRYGFLDDDNFHLHRDFLRLNWSGSEGVLSDIKWVGAPIGMANHFAHYSLSDPTKIAYAGKGALEDSFSVLSLDKYTERYGDMCDGKNSDFSVSFCKPEAAKPEAAKPEGKETRIDIGSLLAGIQNCIFNEADASDARVIQAVADAMSILKHVMEKRS